MRKKLMDPNTSIQEKQAIPMGLHVKFWHAGAKDMKKMMHRAGYNVDVIDLIDKLIPPQCKECATWARTLTKPVVKANLSEHFHHRVQHDLCFMHIRY